MAPAAGEGCFVFATSHGIKGAGLVLSPVPGQVLTPEALDGAPARGCGNAPTVVVISGCFSGSFAARPMARDNRVVLTAARADRTSFGCGADETYPVYDRCLLEAFDGGGTRVAAQAAIRACVAGEERRRRVPASDPQAWFGSAMPDMRVPGG